MIMPLLGPCRCAYATLLTRASYLPGVLTLAHTLRKHTGYPLLVLTTPLPDDLKSILEREAALNPTIQIVPIEPLHPPSTPENGNGKSAASRFADTWTKLRVFELVSYDRVVFLDADVVVFHTIDALFNVNLPSSSWIAATPACICNLDLDSWAPEEWKPEGCAYTLASTNSIVETGDGSLGKLDPPPLNSGVFLFHPSEELKQSVMKTFAESDKLAEYPCPDQDFMAYEVFRGKWMPLNWAFNALKTMRYWHGNLWHSEKGDQEVRVLHYIVDKPWQKRIASDGIAGYLGRDGETHSWWWTIWSEWSNQRIESEEGKALIADVESLNVVAKELDEASDKKQVEDNKEHKLPVEVATRNGMSDKAKDVAIATNDALGFSR